MTPVSTPAPAPDLAPRRLRRGLRLLHAAPLLLFAAVVVGFGMLSPRFWSLQNALNILLQSASLAVMAVGMGFVLLVGGIDLSIGAAVYVGAVVLTMFLQDASPALALAAALGVGLAFGAVNGLLVVRLRVTAFIATLAMLFIGRGLGLYLSNTQGLSASPALTDLARAHWLQVPAALALAGVAIVAAVVLLRATPFGLALHATGADREAARRAGVDVARASFFAYALCGLYAGLGGFISLLQVGFVSSAFGEDFEFLAVAAAVLGGASLFGGRGGVGGPVLGAVLIQTVQNALVMTGSDPYLYAQVTAACIFAAVLIDSLRRRAVARLERRRILAAP